MHEVYSTVSRELEAFQTLTQTLKNNEFMLFYDAVLSRMLEQKNNIYTGRPNKIKNVTLFKIRHMNSQNESRFMSNKIK